MSVLVQCTLRSVRMANAFPILKETILQPSHFLLYSKRELKISYEPHQNNLFGETKIIPNGRKWKMWSHHFESVLQQISEFLDNNQFGEQVWKIKLMLLSAIQQDFMKNVIKWESEISFLEFWCMSVFEQTFYSRTNIMSNLYIR